MTTKTLKGLPKLVGGRERGGRVTKKTVGDKPYTKRTGRTIKGSLVSQPDPALESVLSSATDLYEQGLISESRMREYERHCVAPPPMFTGKKIQGLRKRFGWSQTFLAAKIGASASTVEKWEAGVNSPSGPALRILDIIDRKGAQILE